MDVKTTVDDLMGFLLYELKSRNMPVSEFNMQKLIFKIKMDLSENHELYPKLPFYWYLKGPYSDVVSQSFNSFMAKCNKFGNSILYKNDIFNDYNHNNLLLSQFCEIEDISRNIINDKDFFYNRLDKEIYRQYAPYKFMYSYKYGIYDVVKCMDVVDFDVDSFMDKLYDCESELPIPEFFNEFKSYYSNLTSNLALINLAGNFNKYWVDLREPILLIWETFAKGVRVKFKDDFYNNKINQWELDFKKSLKDLKNSIDKTELLINSKDYYKKEYTAKQKELLDLSFENYMGG